MFVSMPNRDPDGIVSERVADVDVVCADVLHKLGETSDMEGGISSLMGEEVLDWGSTRLRSTMWVLGVDFWFLTPPGGLVTFFLRGLGMVDLKCEWGPTTDIVTKRGGITRGLCFIKPWDTIELETELDDMPIFVMVSFKELMCFFSFESTDYNSYSTIHFLDFITISPVNGDSTIPSKKYRNLLSLISPVNPDHDPTSAWKSSVHSTNFWALIWKVWGWT